MRLSMYPNDPLGGFEAMQAARGRGADIRITLNGVVIERCLVADEERSYIEVLDTRDPLDKFSSPPKLRTIRRSGYVRIYPRPPVGSEAS